MNMSLPTYSPTDLLEDHKGVIFTDIVSVRYPLTNAGGYMRRMRRENMFNDIQHKINSLSMEEREEILKELMALDPHEDTLISWAKTYEKLKEKDLKKLKETFTSAEALFRGSKTKQVEILYEMLSKVKSDLVGVQEYLRQKADYTEDIEPLLVMDETITHLRNATDIMRHAKKDELAQIAGIIFILLIRLEKYRRGMIDLDRLYWTNATAFRILSRVKKPESKITAELVNILAE